MPAYIVTGPTSGMGRYAALELAKHGTVILVGRDRAKLAQVQKTVRQKGREAVSVVCDLSDIVSVRRAAAEIIALNLPIAGLLNNAGIRQSIPTKSAQGWDLSFATNHLGPFALTEALMPHLPDGANILFVASATEDPQRQPAARFGFRGGRSTFPRKPARGANGNPAAQRSPASTATPRRNSLRSSPPSNSPARTRASTSTPLSPA